MTQEQIDTINEVIEQLSQTTTYSEEDVLNDLALLEKEQQPECYEGVFLDHAICIYKLKSILPK